MPAAIVYNPEAAPAPVATVPTLPSDPMMTAAFIGTLKLSTKQIGALRRLVEDEEVEWRPIKDGGPPAIPYLSHNGYRDRLDAAFGLGGWGMVPVGQPKEKDDIVYVPFALIVGGVPRVYAWGEQRYFETNREGNRSQMTYGDVLEGAKSNAIVRCGKELGIARELWNRAYIRQLKLRVLSQETQRAGRSRAPAEDAEAQTAQPRAPRTAPPAGHHAQVDEPITDPQRQRLWVIARRTGRTEPELKTWLKARYGLTSTKAIRRRDYEAICTAVAHPGPLADSDLQAEREPGSDDQ